MEWLFILALGVWVYRQERTIRGLERRLNAIDERKQLTRDDVAAPQQVVPPTSPWVAEPAFVKQPEPQAAPPTTAPAKPIVPASIPLALPQLTVAASAPDPERLSTPAPAPEQDREPRPQPILPPTITREAISTWLSENGLAWIGGGGLALGGLLLVGYAAQRGFFTPQLRITLAVILGALMVAASEWILRQKPSIAGGRHLLAAAVSAGAGAVTLYGAVCAAHGLYHLIPLGVAAVLVATISLGLLGLSLRHGEPLALVALVGAVFAPSFTDLPDWNTIALTAYAILIGMTGFSIAAARRWGRAGGATTFGLLLLSLLFLADHHILAPMSVQVLAAIGPFVATLWRRRLGQDDAGDPAGRDFQRWPSVALVLSSLASFSLWFATSHALHLPAAAFLSAILVGLGAIMAARDIVRPALFAVPVGTAITCQLLVMALMGRSPGFSPQLPWLYALTCLIPAAALWAALHLAAGPRTRMLAIGGIGVAVLASLTWPLLRAAHIDFGWIPAAVLAAAMFALSALIARRVEKAAVDRGLALWLAAAAELGFLAIHAVTAPRFEPAAFALAAAVLAAAASRLPWRGLAATSVAGGLLAFAAMLQPEFVGAALDGHLPLAIMAAISASSALLLVAAAHLIWKGGGEGARNEAEAQRVAGLLVGLLALFVGLHVVLAGGDRQVEDGLFEASLRTLLLLSAGLLLVLRQRDDDGPIARWRTIIVISLGVAHGLVLQGLVWNPWWGAGQPPAGPALINTLILSYLAPVGLLAAVAWRRRPANDQWTRGWILAAPMFGFLWGLLVLRHLFQGAEMAQAALGRMELAADAVLLMLTARALVEPRLGMMSPQAAWLRAAAPIVGWAALGVTALVFGLLVSPWWGVLPGDVTLASGALLFGLQAVAIALAWGVSRKEATVGRAALVVAVALSLSLAAHLIRWAFHAPALSIGVIGRAEGAAYANLALVAARQLMAPRLADRPSTDWLVRAAPVVGWLSLAVAVLVLGIRSSPWWGPFSQPLAPASSAVLLFGLYLGGAASMLWLRRGDSRFDRTALAASVGTLFVLLTLVIRYAFHGAAMGMAVHGKSLETWTFSALWAVFGLVVLGLGVARKDIILRWAGLATLLLTAGKLMLFDLARLEGVTRAASFLAVGALFVGGAVLARRLNARHKSVAQGSAETIA